MKKSMVKESVKMDLVEIGRKGVTNKQMLDAFKTNLSNMQLVKLALDYPEVFKSSIKYTPDEMKVKLEKLVKAYIDPSFTVKTGKKIRSNQDSFVKVIVLNDYKNKNNAKLAKVAENIKVLNDDEQVIVKEMVEKDLGISEVAKLHGLTKDQAYNKVFRSKSSIYNKLTAAN